ncbi:MAG: NUDIX hydrolase [Cytophagales bacterium]|nr:MAG: NUDIX hydrolase [Cytophagales bacterium]
MAYTYDYPRPALTVDCVIFAKDNGTWKVLLIERKHEPFAGKWALPGGFVDENETVEQAAARELFEETHVQNVPIQQFSVFSAPQRDPRGWTVAVAHWAIVDIKDCKPQAGDDASAAEWVALDSISEMAFDHLLILEEARKVAKIS